MSFACLPAQWYEGAARLQRLEKPLPLIAFARSVIILPGTKAVLATNQPLKVALQNELYHNEVSLLCHDKGSGPKRSWGYAFLAYRNAPERPRPPLQRRRCIE